MRKTIYFILLIALVFGLAACGGSSSGGGDDAAAAGDKLFHQAVIGTQAGCGTCHSVTPDEVIVGPSLAGIATRGDEAYIRESILDPEAKLVDGFPSGTMPQVWGDELSDEQLDQIVAYLLTLK